MKNKIKKLIFDVDNTLIKWKDEYVNVLRDTLIFYNIKCDYEKVNDIIESQEKKYDFLDKNVLLNDINSIMNLDLPISFIDKLIEDQKVLSDVDYELINTLKYLSDKYELVILTNWFGETQKGRLKNAKIDEYFSYIYSGDDGFGTKPKKEAFLRAIGDNKPQECVMIGDSYLCDIKGALNASINAIYLSNDKSFKDDSVIRIENIYELKNIL